MFQLSITPRITVTIGGLTRLYLAYVTTAPIELDLPKTVTVDEGPRPAPVLALPIEQQPREHVPLLAQRSSRDIMLRLLRMK